MGSNTIYRMKAIWALVVALILAALSAAAASADSGGILWSGSSTGFCPEYFEDCEILIAVDIPMTLPVGYVSASYDAISISEGVSVYLKVMIYQNYEAYVFMPDLTDPQQFLSHENLSANFCASAGSACVGRRGSFSVHPFPKNIESAAVHMIVHNHFKPATVQLSGIVEYGMEQSGILPALSDEYFQPYPYDRNPQSPLSNVRIDMQHVVRSVVTVLGFFSENNFLGWIAAFAVIFILLSAFISYFINKFRGG